LQRIRIHNEYRHSRIQFVTPSQRHDGLDVEILSKRKVLYQKKRNEHGERWTKEEWNGQAIGGLELNPERHKEAT
jgi:putative transposase